MTVTLKYTESGDGQPVVLLHAFPVDSGMFAGQHGALGDGVRLITPDQRGFGGSPLRGDPASMGRPSLDIAADDVARLLDSLGLDRAVVGGVSMGGYVTMAFLRRHPERVAGLVLANTKYAADAEEAAQNRLRIAAEVEAAKSSAQLGDEVFPRLLGETTMLKRPEFASSVRVIAENAPPASVAWAQRAMAARPDSEEVLRGADLPALVIVGEEDQITGVAEAQALAAALPKSTLTVLPGAGHLSALEDPEAFNAALTSWLHSL
jgi:pimeloyl-ACP methyl ester carboxylesterase